MKKCVDIRPGKHLQGRIIEDMYCFITMGFRWDLESVRMVKLKTITQRDFEEENKGAVKKVLSKKNAFRYKTWRRSSLFGIIILR